MLIRDAELDFGARRADVRVRDGVVVDVAAHLSRETGEPEVQAAGAALIPALRDHHLHLFATAAAQASVDCAPPAVTSLGTLGAALRAADAALPAGDMVRGIGFDDVVTGDGRPLQREHLDALLPHRPVRLQHRTGRLWVLNSAALERVGALPEEAPAERIGGRPNGRFLDADDWLRARLGGRRPSLARLSRQLADWGVTAVTDTGHANNRDTWAALAQARADGSLLQQVMVMGDDSLNQALPAQPGLRLGARKFHLHEQDLPPLPAVAAAIRAAHAAGRGAAFHCVTEAELVFALGALEAAGGGARDRIEHAALVSPAVAAMLAASAVTVVTQPGFIRTRGDRYRATVPEADQPWLYRLQGLVDAGIGLALSSDAPYGSPDPWQGMQAAVTRQTDSGAVLGPDEALSPEAALAGYLGSLDAPARARRVAVGMPADLCLLPAPWAALRADLGAVRPQRVWQRGRSLLPGESGVDFTSME